MKQLKVLIHFLTQLSLVIQSVATGNQRRGPLKSVLKLFHWSTPLVSIATDLIARLSQKMDQGLETHDNIRPETVDTVNVNVKVKVNVNVNVKVHL